MAGRLIVIPLLLLLLVGCGSGSGIYHPVKQGQTLYRIGKAYGVDSRYLARINGIDEPTRIHAGKVLFIPGARKVLPDLDEPTSRIAPPPRSAVARSSSFEKKPSPSAAKKSPPPPVVKKQAQPAAPVTRAPVKGMFIWPLKGEIVRRFGQKDHQKSNGIEISASPKSSVIASAPGRVTYSGNGVQGYGNLIIIQHSDAYFTIYGYNASNLVETNAYVGRGDRIALSGTPDGEDKGKLHFEIRQGKKAVDPTLYLP